MEGANGIQAPLSDSDVTMHDLPSSRQEPPAVMGQQAELQGAEGVSHQPAWVKIEERATADSSDPSESCDNDSSDLSDSGDDDASLGEASMVISRSSSPAPIQQGPVPIRQAPAPTPQPSTLSLAPATLASHFPSSIRVPHIQWTAEHQRQYDFHLWCVRNAHPVHQNLKSAAPYQHSSASFQQGLAPVQQAPAPIRQPPPPPPPSAIPPPPSEQAYVDMVQNQATAMDTEQQSALTSLNFDPAPLNLKASESRKVRYRPGPAPKSTIMFRGVAIADSNGAVAKADAKRHFELVKKDQHAILCALSAVRTTKWDLAVSVVAFSSLVKSTEQNLVATKWTRSSKIPSEFTPELVAIRHAFNEGLMRVEDRESGADSFGFRPNGCKVKTFTVVAPNFMSVRMIQEFEEARLQKWDRMSNKEEDIIRSIAELSSELAEKKVDVYLYSAPPNSTEPLTKAEVTANIEIQFNVPAMYK